MIDLKELEERVILAAVSTSETDMAERSLDELKELADTAGAKTVGRVIQNRESVHPGTYLGKGKLQELREMLYETGATGVICDDELSPAQLKNLEDILDTKVMDRTMVILDIFAARANTREGKIQVELAQLKYRAIRLVGMRSSLSRLGGGIGTRGPGEKKLETDRRLIHQRIGQLKKELEEMGMFAPEYKQEIPAYAKTIGVVTASTGAAIRDIMNITARRNPYVQLILYPALVQGDGAAASIVRGIHALDVLGVDVIIVGRGGGSHGLDGAAHIVFRAHGGKRVGRQPVVRPVA